jgi:transcriptional regulator with XRE-family HTH domain
MKTIRHCIDEAIRNRRVKNKAEIARRLDIAEATVSRWWHGQSAPDEDLAAGLAEVLGMPEVMAISAAGRAKTKKGRSAWARLAAMLAVAAAAAPAKAATLATTVAFALPFPADLCHSALYIM